jgi:lipoprotein-releasing system permease protein
VYAYGRFDDVERDRARLRLEGVSGVSPAIIDQGFMTFGGQSLGVTLKGIDPRHEREVTDLDKAMVAGSADALLNRPPDARDAMLLGADLAVLLGVQVGDVVDVLSRETTSTLVGIFPRKRFFEVVGIFRFGFYEVDHTQAFISLASAQDFLNRTGPDLMQVRLANLDDAPRIRGAIEDLLGPGAKVVDWTQLNQPLYAALWLEKVAISLTIGLIVMVAALNIVASLVLLVMEKTRDIAILRTLGARALVIRRIFILQGLAIGLIGTAVGTAAGLVVCYFADRYRWISLPADVYQISYLPFHVELWDVVIVVVSAVAVCLVATLYPSRQAGRIDPAEALRNQ